MIRNICLTTLDLPSDVTPDQTEAAFIFSKP